MIAHVHPLDSARGAHLKGPSRADLDAAVERATRKIAPLWPLKHFVAVNPFLGLTGSEFGDAARTMARVAGARMTAPRSFYAEALQEGRITRADLEAALAAATPVHGAPTTVEALEAVATGGEETPAFPVVPTVTDVAREVTGTDFTRLAANTLSSWAASYFDQGQAYWTSPFKDLPPYQAWKAEASIDKTPEATGLPGFRKLVKSLPDTPGDCAELVLRRLGVPEAGLDAYLHRLLMTVGGWAAYARYIVWEAELHGGTDDTLVQFVAIRLAWELAVLEAFEAKGLGEAWEARKAELAEPGLGADVEAALAADLMLQDAFERSVQRHFVTTVSSGKADKPTERKKVQAAFCIDVRSEVFRRAFEHVDPDCETIGFAGFFGFPIEYIPLGEEKGGKACPVLLTPQFTIEETVDGIDDAQRAALEEKRTLRRRVANAWRSFKFAAVACFGFVGPIGMLYLKKILSDSLGKTRPVEHPSAFGLDADVAAKLGPTLRPHEVAGRVTGMTPEQRLAMAKGVLGAMSMTDNFARLVLLVGHGSTTVNNPHRTGLDCGACGGHTGEANARVAAAVLNDPEVRKGLVEGGLPLPDDTVFVGAQHDTCTDEITLFDRHTIPASHAEDVARLEGRLSRAGQLARAERARLLNLPEGASTDAAVLARSTDWSQVRPEWGLAGCAAFIAAPRHRTQGLDLGGRSFLHSYAWQQDEGFGVLELIMTAPMVVASWISLQYYGSTTDNVAFGCGNKTLHNVTGTLGVLEGNGGDLRTGLPWQSVHDGTKYIHEPARLNVMIEAPIEAMNDIIEKHEMVRDLLDHGWLHLYAIDAEGKVSKKYAGGLRWDEVDPTVGQQIAA